MNIGHTFIVGSVWYCAVRHTGGDTVLLNTYSLADAQSALGPNSGRIQSIIPMSGATVNLGGLTSLGGDPHTLAKSWASGSMYWRSWSQINSMRSTCASEAAPTAPSNMGASVRRWSECAVVQYYSDRSVITCIVRSSPLANALPHELHVGTTSSGSDPRLQQDSCPTCHCGRRRGGMQDRVEASGLSRLQDQI